MVFVSGYMCNKTDLAVQTWLVASVVSCKVVLGSSETVLAIAIPFEKHIHELRAITLKPVESVCHLAPCYLHVFRLYMWFYDLVLRSQCDCHNG